MQKQAEKIRDQFVHLRDRLKLKGVDAQQLADLLGVKRQTTYQYGFSPDAHGARIIPAESLDRMRVLYTRLHFEKLNLKWRKLLSIHLDEAFLTTVRSRIEVRVAAQAVEVGPRLRGGLLLREAKP